jgi:cyclic beta-1,2-glucan synthetase
VDGRVDAESLLAFVAAYQSEKQLTLGELWAIPIMLRLGLLENLRGVVERVAAGRKIGKRQRCGSIECCRLPPPHPAQVVLVLAEMVKANPPLSNAFVTECATRMQGGGNGAQFSNHLAGTPRCGAGPDHRRHLPAGEPDSGSRSGFRRQQHRKPAFPGSHRVARFCGTTSSVEQTLRNDPAGVYPLMDFQTRDQYRHVVEEIAKSGNRSEARWLARWCSCRVRRSTIAMRTPHRLLPVRRGPR